MQTPPQTIEGPCATGGQEALRTDGGASVAPGQTANQERKAMKDQAHRIAQVLRIAKKIQQVKDKRAARYFTLWLRVINKERPL